jgi:hypothetical protein
MAKSSGPALATGNELTITQLIPLLKRNAKKKQPVFIWGPPGLGKSTIVASLAKDLGGYCIDLRLSQLGPQDLCGIPYYNKEDNTMSWAHPVLLPTKKFAETIKGTIILFLDEANLCSPAVAAQAYQLINDRKCGTYELPSNVVVFAAGNSEKDGAMVQKMPKPLSNRYTHYEVKADFDSWLDWALIAKIHPDIVAFISQSPNRLFQFDATSPEKAFATPRSWTFGSNLITIDEDDEDYLSDSDIRNLIGSAVGYGMASEYMGFLKVGKNLPKATDILSGKVTTLKITDISAHYQLITAILYAMKDFWDSNSTPTGVMEKTTDGRTYETRKWKSDKVKESWSNQFNNFVYFIMNNFSIEMGALGARIAMKNYNFGKSVDLKKLKYFGDFAEKYGEYLVDK